MHSSLWTLLTLALVCASGVCANNGSASSRGGSQEAGAVGAASAAPCDQQLLFQKLYVFMPAIDQCAKEGGFVIRQDSIEAPSNDTLNLFCNSKNCTQLSVELDDAGLPSCTIPIGNTSEPIKTFFKDLKDHCDDVHKAAAHESAADRVGLLHHPLVVGVIALLLIWK